MKTTIVILNFNTKDLLKKCIESIANQKWKYNFEIWVVDNDSDDGSVDIIKKSFPMVKILETGKNLGFAGGNNVALTKIKTKYCILLNSDTEVLPDSLDNLVDFMERSPSFGITSCKLVNKDGSLQANTGDLPFGLPLVTWISGLDDVFFIGDMLPSFHKKSKDYYNGEKEVGWVSGSAMMIKTEVIDKIGLLDDNLFMYAEDTDFCVRARESGFKVGWTDKAVIKHLGGGSSQEPTYRQWLGEFHGLLYLYKKYYGFFASIMLRLLFYIFIAARVLAYRLIGKKEVSEIYVKVLFNL